MVGQVSCLSGFLSQNSCATGKLPGLLLSRGFNQSSKPWPASHIDPVFIEVKAANASGAARIVTVV